MKQIEIDGRVFGPFAHVSETGDRYDCGDTVLLKAVVGAGVVSNWIAPPAPQFVRTRADVLAELAAIDMRSIRALREGNTARIAELEAQAVALRAELAAL